MNTYFIESLSNLLFHKDLNLSSRTNQVEHSETELCLSVEGSTKSLAMAECKVSSLSHKVEEDPSSSLNFIQIF